MHFFFGLHLAMKKNTVRRCLCPAPKKKNMLFYNRKLMASNGECKNVRASLTLTHIPSKRKLRYLVPVAISRTQLVYSISPLKKNLKMLKPKFHQT